MVMVMALNVTCMTGWRSVLKRLRVVWHLVLITLFCSGDNDEDQDEEPGCESESKCERHDAVTSSE